MADWILKSEPDVFGIGDLLKRPNQEEFWDGVGIIRPAISFGMS